MNDDVRKYIYGALIVFVSGIVLWLSFLFVNACGFTLTCKRAAPLVFRTPIPTLPPATLPANTTGSGQMSVSGRCRVAALDLMGAWVNAGSPETKAFQFTDINGQDCESNFDEVKPLFVEANLWYPGSLSCVSCHSVDLSISPAQLDLSSYKGILAGSRRTDPNSKGTDILGNGKWEGSLLHEFLSKEKSETPGHDAAFSELVIFAGTALPPAESSATPIPTVAPTTTPTP